jgi:hypothetical protein
VIFRETLGVVINNPCQGSLPPAVNLYRLACRASDDCTNGGAHDLYWFGLPESNTLRPIRAVVLFVLICSRGTK